ncbi:anthrax toxin lethal factor-related metalloendopeptidase [Nocardiopsis synnemataformans]|uniref:VG15 protein n=1 Tax=Nocardiopsis synnemataformans TaxID=61305 RepID=UPI003EB944B7
MAAPAVALDHRADSIRIATTTARAVRQEWAQVDTDQIRPSWQNRLPRVLALVVAAQRSAAGLSEPYLRQVLGLEPDAVLNPTALAGVASDGRPLETLLERPVVTVLSYLATGRAVGDAMAAGLAMLELIVGTQVHDAARVADLIGITARRGVAYTRVVELPACDRCIVLAGREYPYSEGFERHPRCDCAIMPIRSGEGAPWLSPRELFNAMSPAEQLRRFGAAAVAAIAAGADIAQVVNARRGMTTAAGRLVTTEGTTRRGYAGSRLAAAAGTARAAGDRYARAATARLMPEQILAEADSREDAIAALIQHGYLSASGARQQAPQPPAPAPAPPKFFEEDGSRDARRVAWELDHVPANIRTTTLAYMRQIPGGGISIGQAPLTQLPGSGPLQTPPRGWAPGSTWDDVAGVWIPDTRRLLISTSRDSGSVSVALHEFGHATDQAHGDLSFDRQWQTLHQLTTGVLRQDPNYNPYYDTPDEWWAESFAAWCLGWDTMVKNCLGNTEVARLLWDYFETQMGGP